MIILQHERKTRGNGSFVCLSKMRTGTGKTSFFYQGTRIFNRSAFSTEVIRKYEMKYLYYD